MKYYLYAIVIILVDQATKWLIKTNMTLGEAHSVIGNFFLLTSHRNKGAAFSILQGQRWLFLVITIAVVIGIIWYLQRMRQERRLLLCFALSLLLGGAVGNFIDRALYGEVVDFLQFNFEFDWFGKHIYYTYPIFNIADAAIVIGVALIFLEAILGARRDNKQRMAATQEHEQEQG
ncbi:signal peptidase II [Paenibacillus chartarius]|uniref:Lipoprotein signal peptidase n=1 Tax=Paenibacillus chartarius TaxID=747481 RepID=A0ABV6DNG5_9BACL